MELFQLVKRELKVIFSRASQIFNIIIFFTIICFSFAFVLLQKIPPEANFQVATAIIIVCFMLSSNLCSQYIFERDIESGILQQLYIRVKSLNNLVFAKILSQFLCFGIPLTFTVPVVSVFFNLSLQNIFLLMLLIFISSFLLATINVMISGITSGLKSGAIISVILSIPLYLPIIVTNILFIEKMAEHGGQPLFSFFQTAFGFALIIIPLAIFSVRQTIRNAVEN